MLKEILSPYRVRQFWSTLAAKPAPDELYRAEQILGPTLMALFLRLQPSEQAHSLQIFAQLQEQRETGPDPELGDGQYAELLIAALLHDIGKCLVPLYPWERAWIVAAKALFPDKILRWGQGEPRGWRRPFVVAMCHPAWGAALAEQAGASPLAVALIRRHQDPLLAPMDSVEDKLLLKLQALDDRN